MSFQVDSAAPDSSQLTPGPLKTDESASSSSPHTAVSIVPPSPTSESAAAAKAAASKQGAPARRESQLAVETDDLDRNPYYMPSDMAIPKSPMVQSAPLSPVNHDDLPATPQDPRSGLALSPMPGSPSGEVDNGPDAGDDLYGSAEAGEGVLLETFLNDVEEIHAE